MRTEEGSGAMMGIWRELSRLVDELLTPRSRAILTVVLLANAVFTWIALYDHLRSDTMRHVAQIAWNGDDSGVIPVTIPSEASDGPLISMRWRRQVIESPRHTLVVESGLCVDARLGYVTAGGRRIRLASAPMARWTSVGRVVAVPVSARTPGCPGNPVYDGFYSSEGDATLSSGSTFLLVGSIEREGRDWRTVDGYGISLDSSPADLIGCSRSSLHLALFELVYALGSTFALALVLFGGPRTRWFNRVSG